MLALDSEGDLNLVLRRLAVVFARGDEDAGLVLALGAVAVHLRVDGFRLSERIRDMPDDFLETLPQRNRELVEFAVSLLLAPLPVAASGAHLLAARFGRRHARAAGAMSMSAHRVPFPVLIDDCRYEILLEHVLHSKSFARVVPSEERVNRKVIIHKVGLMGCFAS